MYPIDVTLYASQAYNGNKQQVPYDILKKVLRFQ